MTKDGKLEVYIGCALTHAPEKFKQDISRLKDTLRDSVHVLDFLGQSTKYTPEEVFVFDIRCVRSCDVFVANVTYPSLGLGAEFGVAVERRKPIITIAEKEAVVSRFVFGYANPQHFIYRYEHIADAARFVEEKLKNIHAATAFLQE